MKRPLLCCLTLGLSLLPSAAAEAPRPNILLIVADDLGYSDIGSYGGEIQTPHLDQLATDGLRFTQFYNCGVCVTTRASIYTGLYPRFPGRASGANAALAPDMPSLGRQLQAAGYQTALTGKWHLGHEAPNRPIDRGFDEFYGLLDGASSFFDPKKPDPEFYNGGVVRNFAHNEQEVMVFPDDYYTTDAFTDHAIKTLLDFAAEDRPFFINLNYTAPHFPLHARPEDIEKYRGKYAGGYQQIRVRRQKRQTELGLFGTDPVSLSARESRASDFRYDYGAANWDDLNEATRAREEERMEVYAAMVDRMDQGIGRVLAALESTGQADHTLVVFISDNGGCASWPTEETEAAFEAYNSGIPVGDPRGYEFVGQTWGWAQNAPFRRHKTWVYEGGIATPMIVRWPAKITPGTITHEPGHVVDFLPTFLELSNAAEIPVEAEGQSLLPSFHGDKRPPRELGWALFGNYAWREGNLKLIYNVARQEWELYDLGEDRAETLNIAADHPETVKRLRSAWWDWAKRCGITEL
jgi:arylsulfatase A-like enzyme